MASSYSTNLDVDTNILVTYVSPLGTLDAKIKTCLASLWRRARNAHGHSSMYREICGFYAQDVDRLHILDKVSSTPILYVGR